MTPPLAAAAAISILASLPQQALAQPAGQGIDPSTALPEQALQEQALQEEARQEQAQPERVEPQPTDDWVEPLLEALNSEELAARELASAQMLVSEDISLTQLETILRERELSPEQRVRIMQAAETRFRAAPRPAIGIQLSTEPNASPTITGLIPGFDAANKLIVNDTILEISGEPIMSLPDLRTVTFSNAPGDTVELLIRRDGQQLSLPIVLGQFGNLGTARFSEQELSQAWQFRVRANNTDPGQPEPIDSGVIPGAWPEPTTDPRRASRGVVAGGVARPRPGSSLPIRLQAPLDGEMDAQRVELREGLINAINDLERSLARSRRTAELQRASLERGDLSRERRQQLEESLVIQERQIAELETRLDRLADFLDVFDQP